MTNPRLYRRAEFIRDEPTIWFAYLLGTSFLGFSLGFDLVHLFFSLPPSMGLLRYCLAFSNTVVVCIGTRSWSRRVIAAQHATSP